MSSSTPPRVAGHWVVAALGSMAVIAALYAPLLAGRASWPSARFTDRVAPAQVAAARSLRQQVAPWWWDESGFGEPLAPVAEVAALSPTTALATSERAAALLALGHLALLALALLALARRLALPPALAAAAVVVLAGLCSRWPAQLAAAAWAALALSALLALRTASERGHQRAQRSSAWALAAALALTVLAGGPALAGLVVVLAAVLLRRAPARVRWQLALAVAGAAGVGAVQWLPAALADELTLGERLGAGTVAAVATALLALAFAARRLPPVAPLVASLGALALAGGVAAVVRGPLPVREPAALPLSPARAVAPARVFCPTPVPAAQATAAHTTDRALALDPGRALSTEVARAAGWRCVPGRWRQPTQEQALWRRGAMAGGRLLRRWAIAYALVPRSTVVAAGFHELAALATWSLVAVPARPMAAVYHQWVAVADAAAARRHLLEELQRGDWLLVESAGPSHLAAPPPPALDEPGQAPDPAPGEDVEEAPAEAADHGHTHQAQAEGGAPPLAGPVAEPCAIVRWRPGDVALRCRASAPAMAAVAIPHRPGWQVTLDGAPAARLRAEGVLSAVALPPGEHQVHWRYRPRGAEVAVAVSSGTLLLAAVGFVVMLVGRRRARSETP